MTSKVTTVENNTINKPGNKKLVKTSLIDENMKKSFQEKRKARFDEIQAKIALQREKKSSNMDPINILKKNESIKKVKKTIPKLEIKQTKASQLRLEKNNPLHGYDHDQLKKILQPSVSSKNLSLQLRHTATKENVEKRAFSAQKSKSNILSSRQSRIEELSKPKNFKTPSKINNLVDNKSRKTNILQRPQVRRSISAVHMNRMGIAQAQKCIQKVNSVKSYSEENISSVGTLNIPSPIVEEPAISATARKAVMFITPDINRRKSIKFSTPVNRTPAPTELRERLLNWLKKRGKSLNAYSHLRCFGVHQSTPYRPSRVTSTVTNANLNNEEDENKENRAELAPVIADDWTPKIVDYTNFTSNADLFGEPDGVDKYKVAREALCELHSLILEKYPEDQCTAWLSALTRKYPHIQEQPEYWECQAALGELNGEFNEAVECYQEAIIRGAEVNKIDHSIEKLLEKFSVLDLDSSTKKQDTAAKKQRSKVILDARNIFKSSVIKFALHQRENKKRDEANTLTPLVVKPVRRSTRLTRTSFLSTPNETLYSSMNDIDVSLRSSVQFRENRALFEN